MITLTVADLHVFEPGMDAEQAAIMIGDAIALAYQVAPCLRDTDDEDALTIAAAVCRTAILRWHEGGSGAVTQVSTLDFSQTIDNRNPRRGGVFYPSEIKQLRQCCGRAGKAFMIDLAPNARY